jgi:hypothetical protein
MRRLLIAVAIAMLPSIALAHGGHGGGGGHMGGGWSGGHMSGGNRAALGAARVGGWTGSHAVAWGGGRFHGHGRFVHRHGRVFFVGFGGGPWWVGGYDNCWQWVPTVWGPRRVWACDYSY